MKSKLINIIDISEREREINLKFTYSNEKVNQKAHIESQIYLLYNIFAKRSAPLNVLVI